MPFLLPSGSALCPSELQASASQLAGQARPPAPPVRSGVHRYVLSASWKSSLARYTSILGCQSAHPGGSGSQDKRWTEDRCVPPWPWRHCTHTDRMGQKGTATAHRRVGSHPPLVSLTYTALSHKRAILRFLSFYSMWARPCTWGHTQGTLRVGRDMVAGSSQPQGQWGCGTGAGAPSSPGVRCRSTSLWCSRGGLCVAGSVGELSAQSYMLVRPLLGLRY